jgi:pyrroline-5-carboxylate reductase
MTTVLVGGGVMGESILAGLLDSGSRPADVRVVEPRAERADELRDRYGVTVGPDAMVDRGVDVLVVAVKPHDVPRVLAPLAESLAADCVVVSVAAGVTTAALESVLTVGQPVVRAMPNTPALVRAGVSAICAGQHATDEHLRVAETLLSSVGAVVEVPESQIDAVAAVSGSGPAYVYLVAEALIEAGVRVGLPRGLATELTRATISGSARLWSETGEHPTLLRERVTSPGGTTAAALHALEARGLRAAFSEAVVANTARSAELGTS